MRTKKVTRHYCDFCGKGSFRKPDMQSHESSCTLNPNRECYLCNNRFDFAKLATSMKDREDVFLDDEAAPPIWRVDSSKAIHWLMGQVESCPACALSVLRQGGIIAFDYFDYRTFLAEWNADETKDLV